jgi:methionyl-tRNA synthetase
MKYITTPIYYINGAPHIGHAYTTIIGDVMKRIFQMQGKDVFYTTGTDENGQKNQQTCNDLGVTPEDYKTNNSNKFKDLFNSLNISYDYFVRTSNPRHEQIVQECLNKIFDDGMIIKKSYEGLYCVGCEQFKTEKDLDENGNCPDHQTKPQLITEENYFLRLEPYREWLIEHINQNPDWIQPDLFKAKLLDMLKDPLEDLCISRPKSRVTWGIELPFDTDFVTYIWFDALVNYISSLDYGNNGEFDSIWADSMHVIGKDILKPHAVYWPIMLKALGLRPVNRLRVHGFLIGEDGLKMSKSLGNVVSPVEMIDKYGVDCLRFYLVDSILFARDAKVSANLIEESYIRLGNILGNLQMRSCKMLEKYRNSIIPEKNLTEEDNKFLTKLSQGLITAFVEFDDMHSLPKVTKSITEACSAVNTYIDQAKPWELAKDEVDSDKLDSCLYTLMESIRIIGFSIYPVMPNISKKILSVYGLEDEENTLKQFALGGLESGAKLNEVEMLFPKLD